MREYWKDPYKLSNGWLPLFGNLQIDSLIPTEHHQEKTEEKTFRPGAQTFTWIRVNTCFHRHRGLSSFFPPVPPFGFSFEDVNLSGPVEVKTQIAQVLSDASMALAIGPRSQSRSFWDVLRPCERAWSEAHEGAFWLWFAKRFTRKDRSGMRFGEFSMLLVSPLLFLGV